MTERVAGLVALYPSRRAAAAAAQVSVDQISRYASGVNAAPFPVLSRLAVAQGVCLNWLATGRGPMRRDEPAEPASQGLVVWGMQPAGETGWYRMAPLSVRLPPLNGLSPAETLVVMAPDDHLRGEGIRGGYICYCSLGSQAYAGDVVLLRRPDQTVSFAVQDAGVPADGLSPVPVVQIRRRW